MTKHKKIQQMLAYYDELVPDERGQMDAHIQTCAECRRLFDSYREVDELIISSATLVEAQDGMPVYDQMWATAGVREAQQSLPMTQVLEQPARLDNQIYRLPRLSATSIQLAGAAVILLFVLLLGRAIAGSNSLIQRLMAVRTTTQDMNATIADEANVIDKVSAAEDIVMIRFGCNIDSRCEPYQALVNDFHALHPNIRVELVANPTKHDDSAEKKRRAYEAYVANTDVVSQIGNAPEPLLPLDPFIAADPTVELDDFYTLIAHSDDDAVYGIPAGFMLNMLYYNKELFDEAGIAYPQNNWTRAEFLAIAQQLTKQSGDEIQQYGFVDFGFMKSGITADLVPNRSLWDQPASVRLQDAKQDMTWYTDLGLKHHVMPTLKRRPSEQWLVEMRGRIKGGEVAMWTDSLNNSKSILRKDGTIGLAPMPFQQQEAFVTIDVFGIRARTQHSQESWRWLEFLTQRRPVNDDGYNQAAPVRRTTAYNTRYFDHWTFEDAEAIRTTLENLWPEVRQEDSAYSLAGLALDDAIYDIFAGSSVDGALMDAQTKLDKKLAKKSNPE